MLEALTGVKRSFEHLDGLVYNYETKPGEVVNFTDKKVLKNMGLPYYRDYLRNGNLVINFQVEMPTTLYLAPQQIAQLQ